MKDVVTEGTAMMVIAQVYEATAQSVDVQIRLRYFHILRVLESQCFRPRMFCRNICYQAIAWFNPLGSADLA